MPGPDVLAALVAGTKAKAADLNDKFDSIKAWGSAIPLDDLADGSGAQLILCNSSGVPTFRTVSGEASISSTGVITLVQKYRSHVQGADSTLAAAGLVPGMQTAALESGVWIVYAKMDIETTSGGAVNGAQFQIEKNADTGLAIFKMSAPASSAATGSSVGVLTSGGADYARLTVGVAAAGSLNGVGVRGVLIALKVQ